MKAATTSSNHMCHQMGNTKGNEPISVNAMSGSKKGSHVHALLREGSDRGS